MTTELKLYEISESMERLRDKIEEKEGVLDDETTALLDTINGSLPVKIEGCGKMMLQLKAGADGLAAEISRLQDRKKATENSRKWLGQYVMFHLQKLGMEKVKGETLTVAIQDSPPSAEVVDEAAVPRQYKDIKLTLSGELWDEIHDALPEGLQKKLQKEMENGVATMKTDVRRKAVVKLWRDSEGVAEVPGVKVTRGQHVRVR